VLPTFNEAENVKQLIPSLIKIFDSTKNVNPIALFVDDGSPDGTGKEIKKFSNVDKRIKIIERNKKNGLGKAYATGIRIAINNYHADYIIQMDSDLSHDPKYLKVFFKKASEGADFVIGSRYVAGGKIVGWNALRKLISFGGNFFARSIIGLRPKDCTSGYRLIKKSVFEDFDFEKLDAKGYSILTQILLLAKKKGAKIEEIPIIFVDRKYGKTKLGFKDIIEFLLNAIKIGLKENKLLKFLIVGGFGTIVNTFMLFTLTEFVFNNYLYSAPLAIETSIITNFLLNDNWTWKGIGEKGKKKSFLRLAKYNSAMICSMVINIILLFLMTSFIGIYYLISNVISIAIVTAINYLINDKIIWNKQTKIERGEKDEFH
jgi:dolichol-phosphate mannosyltransferase